MTKLTEMWAALAAYQPQAEAAGHGASWAKMCTAKTYTAGAAAAAAAYDADADTAGAYAAAFYAADAADAAERGAQKAIDSINRVLIKPPPHHNITFHNQGGKHVGELNFNGPEMVFTGDADESANVFFDFIASAFKARLEQERADMKERCAKMCDQLAIEDGLHQAKYCANAIRGRMDE